MSRHKLANFLVQAWYRQHLIWLTLLLLPIAYLFRLVVLVRKYCYQYHLFTSTCLPVPVVIVGNLTVGGTGKTPFVIWLVNYLQSNHIKVGVISRGYGGNNNQAPVFINNSSHAIEVGEEPILIYQQTNCPVVVCKNRVAAANYLLAKTSCEIIISDDGLQHYALARDLEIAFIDGTKRYGNGQCLPEGPLREPLSRLTTVDYIIVTVGNSLQETVMQLLPQGLILLINPSQQVDKFMLQDKVIHAVAGIGHPERFFHMLRTLKLRFFEHSFPDHYHYTKESLNFGEDAVIVMTEKDAIKCKEFATKDFYYLPVKAELPERFSGNLLTRVRQLLSKEH